MIAFLRGYLDPLWNRVATPLARNAGWTAGGNAVVAAAGFAHTAVVAKGLGSAEFGRFALVAAVAATVAALADLRLHEAVIRYVAEARSRQDPAGARAVIGLALRTNLLAGLLAFAVIEIAATPLSLLVGGGTEGASLVRLSGLVILAGSTGTSVAIGVLRELDGFRYLTVTQAAGALLKLVLATAVLAAGGGVRAAIMATVIATAVMAVLLLAGALVRVKRALPAPDDSDTSPGSLRSRYREMLRFTTGNYSTTILGNVTRDIDMIVLGAFVSGEQAGFYRVAKSFLAAIWMASDPVFFALYPELAKLWSAGRFQDLVHLVRRLTGWLAAAAVALVGLLILVVPWLITTLIGAQFAPAGTMFIAMAWCALAWLPLLWAPGLASVSGQSWVSAVALGLAQMVTLALYVILAPSHGGVGVALAYATGVALNPLLVLYWIWRSGLYARLAAPPAMTQAHLH